VSFDIVNLFHWLRQTRGNPNVMSLYCFIEQAPDEIEFQAQKCKQSRLFFHSAQEKKLFNFLKTERNTLAFSGLIKDSNFSWFDKTSSLFWFDKKVQLFRVYKTL
jgi:hypothetical protein